MHALFPPLRRKARRTACVERPPYAHPAPSRMRSHGRSPTPAPLKSPRRRGETCRRRPGQLTSMPAHSRVPPTAKLGLQDHMGQGRAAWRRCSSPSSGVSQTCQRRESHPSLSSGRTGLALLSWSGSHQSGSCSQRPWSSQSPRCSKCHRRHGGHLLRPHRDCTCVQPQEPPWNHLCFPPGSQRTRIQ